MKADSLARMMSSTGFSFSLTPGIARTFATSSLSLPRWSTAILLMEVLAASGSLSQRISRLSSLGVRSVSLGAAVSAVGTSLTPPRMSVIELKMLVRSVPSLVAIRKGNRGLGHDEALARASVLPS